MVIKNKQTSFTLIELLVVIVIIGILAGVIMISTSSSIDKASIAKLKVFEESVKNNLLMNLVSEWEFDGPTAIGNTATNNDVTDTWGNKNGTVYGNPIIRGESDCVSQKCLEFDGDGDYVSFPHPSVGASPVLFTISGWIKPKNTSSRFLTPQSYGPDHYLHFITSRIGVEICETSDTNERSHESPSGSVPLNQWTHFEVSVDDANNNIKIYINGNLRANVIDTVPIANWDSGWILGQRGNSTYYYQGSVDTFRVYNAALSSFQIKRNYVAELKSLYSKGLILKDEFGQRLVELQVDKF